MVVVEALKGEAGLALSVVVHRTIVQILSGLYVVDMSDINAFCTEYPQNKGYEDNSLLGPL